ncbi:NFX1-type zinc finger-containing protein 1-like [Mytilus californianus]|uniref:NFX1-type zinc finger-containing protein 1-like n=1 Tax=Mytilus californianus TaxID=6549 RepID=UPI0022457A67|nr:NFX1-type zinc finger-containing protein 1-like [Mytilus californianus]
MGRYKRGTPISSGGYNLRSTKTSNVNRNKSVRQSIDYSGVDFNALSVIITHEDKVNDDVIDISHSSKEGPTLNKSQCTSNEKPNKDDIDNSTKDAYRKSVSELQGAKSNRSFSPCLGSITLNQSVSNCQKMSNSFQDNDNPYKISRPNIVLETNKTHKSDNNVGNLDAKRRETFSSKNEKKYPGKRRHKSRSLSTESNRRKRIRSSTNFVGDVKHKQQSSRNDKIRDGEHPYSVGRPDKSPACHFYGRYRRKIKFERQSSFREKIDQRLPYHKGTKSLRSTAYRERSPLRHTPGQQRGHVSRLHAYHSSPCKNTDLHLSSNRNYEFCHDQNPTFDKISRSCNTEYDRNIQRTHELESRHEHTWHTVSSNSNNEVFRWQKPTFDRRSRLNVDINSEYDRYSHRTHEKERTFENIRQGVSSNRNYDICREQNSTVDRRSRSNYGINTGYVNNSKSTYEKESQHETTWQGVSSNRNYELSGQNRTFDRLSRSNMDIHTEYYRNIQRPHQLARRHEQTWEGVSSNSNNDLCRWQDPTFDRRSRLNIDINTEYDQNTETKHEIESRHENTWHRVSPNRNYEPCGQIPPIDKRSCFNVNINTEYGRNIQRTHENINRRMNHKETYESRSNSKSNVPSTKQYNCEKKMLTHNSQNGFEASHQKIDIEKLSKMDSDSLAAHLSTYSRELDTFLFKDVRREQMSLFLQVMCQLCKCKREVLVQKALNPLKERRFFDRPDIKKIICELRLQFDEEKIQILQNLLVLMKGLAYHANTGPSDLITPLDSLERCVNEKLKNGNQQSNLKALIQQIRDKWDPAKTLCDENKLSTLSILPDLIEIESSCASSLIDSEFDTEESYLRRLFMVHRQDFIRPLCKGLMSLKNTLFADPYCLEKKWRHDDIRVYKDICFLSRCCNEQNGITWKISFDITPYSRINWNIRKLLTFGSLVCLTNRTFTILQYATVADRNAVDLNNGIFEIKFIDDIGDMSEILQQPDVLQVESQAFFPSYFHTLNSLKCMYSEIFNAEKRLPFGKQLLNKRNSVEQEKPDYFKSPSFVEKGFDIRCLHSEQKAVKVDISNEANWPDADSLGMDDSQHQAFITSMNSKLALIQGPPGTGKTVAELLLRNDSIWRQQDDQGPMLLLSYTNHALDQFLIDISKRLQITDAAAIVRLGSRSEIEILSKYNLTAKRKAYSYKDEESITRGGEIRIRTKRETSSVLNVLAYNAKSNLKQRIKEHENLKKLREEIQTGIVHQDWLHGVANAITDKQYNALRNESSLIRWLKVESVTQQVVNIQQNYLENIYEDDDFEYFDEEENWYDDLSGDYDEEGIQTLEKLQLMHLDLEKLKMVISSSIVFSKEKTQSNQWFWEQYNEYKKSVFIKKIEEKLCCTQAMPFEDACSVSNIWNIDYPQRWQLYKYWIQQSLIPINKEIQECEESYRRAQGRYEEIQHIADINILKRAKLVACTTTRAARDIGILKRVSPRIVLLEEAAEIPEHHVVACLTSSCKQLIMIGDHQQLRPSYNDYQTARQHKINISLFERLIRGRFPYKRLEYQHRMRPTISKLLVPHIYRTLQDDQSVFEYENVKGINCNVFFLSHSEFEDQEHDEFSRSHKNEFEALFICKLYRYIRMQGYPSSKITVLSTYKDQVRLLRNKIRTEDQTISRNEFFTDDFVNYSGISSREDQPSVRVTAVDNFQGEENDIILLSLVRSNKENKIGYLSEANRVCVALSRAKIGLYVIGNFELLKSRSELWNNIVIDAENRKSVGSKLHLTCQNHKNSTYVSKPDDFDQVADGGCQEPCDVKRQCGHFCSRKCHVDDSDHEDDCQKECHRVCESGHRCMKSCHFPDPCEKCSEIVEKTIPKCQHKKRMPCHKDPKSSSCDERCQAIIACGHRCQKHCTDPCNTEDDCKELIKVKARCGHEVQVACYTKYDPPCKLPCQGILKCGHECKGTHSECSQGRLHIPCKAKCERNMVCGHICRDNCNYRCPPCKQKCDRKCFHGDRCKKRCSDSCIQCTEPCKWECKAECQNKFKCEQVCMELCERPKCNTLCNTILDCGLGHKCSGLLCECSKCVCKVCENLTEILFGYEEEDNAIFIRLEDCTCVFEVNGLDQHISNVMDNTSDEIKSLKCPKCSTKISKSKRYSNELKIINKNICDVFRTIRNIEEGTDLHSKRFATRQLLTDNKYDIPRDKFNQLRDKIEKTGRVDTLNMIFDQLTFYKEIRNIRKEIITFKYCRQLKAWLDRLETWVFLKRSRYARQEHTEFFSRNTTTTAYD